MVAAKSNASVLILDNGASSVKAGYSNAKEPSVVFNGIAKSKKERKRVFIGDEMNECADVTGLFYVLPTQNGFVVNWDVQQQVWDRIFSASLLNTHCRDTTLLLTEPMHNFVSLQQDTQEIVFEQYQFAASYISTAGALSAFNYTRSRPESLGTCTVVDAGFSCSFVAPYVCGKSVAEAVKRISVGGKLLTNQLKEIVSYRQLQVMEETHVMNQCKEDACFVSSQFDVDMKTCKQRGNAIEREYVLPDFMKHQRGHLRKIGSAQKDDMSQVRRVDWRLLDIASLMHRNELHPTRHAECIRLNHERFTIPELLFRPSDIGIKECGVTECTTRTIIDNCPESSHARLCANVVLTGGSTLFRGFADRFHSDIRTSIPAVYDVNVYQPPNPVTYAWHGGRALSETSRFRDLTVSRAEYLEHGVQLCAQRFAQPFVVFNDK